MNKLTDLEICKRIAEIDGVKVRDIGGVICILEATGSSLMKTPTTRYNPLTDDALNHQLMIKYKIDVLNPCKFVNAYVCFKSGNAAKIKATDKNLNKAICLAIIEANKDIN